jgi:hypothetical protein
MENNNNDDDGWNSPEETATPRRNLKQSEHAEPNEPKMEFVMEGFDGGPPPRNK